MFQWPKFIPEAISLGSQKLLFCARVKLHGSSDDVLSDKPRKHVQYMIFCLPAAVYLRRVIEIYVKNCRIYKVTKIAMH